MKRHIHFCNILVLCFYATLSQAADRVSDDQLPDIRLNSPDFDRTPSPRSPRKPIDLSYLEPKFDTQAFEKEVLARVWEQAPNDTIQSLNIAPAEPYAVTPNHSAFNAASFHDPLATTVRTANHPGTRALLTNLAVAAVAEQSEHPDLQDIAFTLALPTDSLSFDLRQNFVTDSVKEWLSSVQFDFTALSLSIEAVLPIDTNALQLLQLLPTVLGRGFLIPETNTYLLLGSFCLAGIVLTRRSRKRAA